MRCRATTLRGRLDPGLATGRATGSPGYTPYQEAAIELFRRFGPLAHGLSWESFHRSQPGRFYAIRYHRTICSFLPGRPISTSCAEGSVAEIANAWMAKRRRMCWSPRGAHCVASVRAAVLDGRLHDLTTMQFAA